MVAPAGQAARSATCGLVAVVAKATSGQSRKTSPGLPATATSIGRAPGSSESIPRRRSANEPARSPSRS